MILDIDDNLPSKERKRLLRTGPIEYALIKFEGNRQHASDWLGISIRTVRNVINEDPALFKYKNVVLILAANPDPPEERLTLDQRCRFNEERDIMKGKPGWIYADEKRRTFLYTKLLNKYLKEEL